MKRGLFPKKPVKKDYVSKQDTYYEDLSKFEDAKKKYAEAVLKYVNEHGINTISMAKIRALLQNEYIESRGGRPILEWRWDRYLNGEPVHRKREYLKKRDLQPFTRFKTTASYNMTHYMFKVPLNVWRCGILPYLLVDDLFNLMYTCKHFQSVSHVALFTIAQKEFGEKGTPMALDSERKTKFIVPEKEVFDKFHVYNFFGELNYVKKIIKSAIFTYGSIEYCKDYPNYKKEQNETSRLDSVMESEFVNQNRSIINEAIGNDLPFVKIYVIGIMRCTFLEYTTKCVAPYVVIDGWSSKTFLKTCSTLLNHGSITLEYAKKVLKPKMPPDFLSVICKLLEHCHESELFQLMYRDDTDNNIKMFFYALQIEHNSRGIDWLKNNVIKCLKNFTTGFHFRPYMTRFNSTHDSFKVVLVSKQYFKDTYNYKHHVLKVNGMKEGLLFSEVIHKKIKRE